MGSHRHCRIFSRSLLAATWQPLDSRFCRGRWQTRSLAQPHQVQVSGLVLVQRLSRWQGRPGGREGGQVPARPRRRDPLQSNQGGPTDPHSCGLQSRQLDESECDRECMVLDWQTFCEGPGLYDVASIAVCSITAEDRKKHCDELLRAYQGALKDRGVDYPWEQLMEDFRVVILQQAFLVYYAFEQVSAEDCPLLFTRARRRIMTAISDYNCLDLFFAKKKAIAVLPIDLSQILGEVIKDFDVTSLGEESSAGYFSTTERIHIVHDHPALPSSLILKSEGGFNDSLSEMAERVCACEREHLFYSKLAPSLPAGIASRLPRVYHTTPASILMEDLAPRAEVANQEEGLDLSFAKEAIVIAASFHAPFWPQPGSRSIPDFVVGGGKPDHWLNLIKCKSADLYSSRGFLGGRGDPEDEKVGKFLHDHADEILSRATKEAPQTLIHADYRAGNLMRVSATGECMVLDWQTF